MRVRKELICGYANVVHTSSSFRPHTHSYHLRTANRDGAKSGHCPATERPSTERDDKTGVRRLPESEARSGATLPDCTNLITVYNYTQRLA